jgi:hypothetical protein
MEHDALAVPLSLSPRPRESGSVSAFNGGGGFTPHSLALASQQAAQRTDRHSTPLQYQQPPHLAEKPSQQDRDGERARNREHPAGGAVSQ